MACLPELDAGGRADDSAPHQSSRARHPSGRPTTSTSCCTSRPSAAYPEAVATALEGLGYRFQPSIDHRNNTAHRCVRGTSNGTHSLWHFYASTALHEGESIKALSEYLGHADPGFTLRAYTHLVEDSAERTKRAVDAVFGHQIPEPEPEDAQPDDEEPAGDLDPDDDDV